MKAIQPTIAVCAALLISVAFAGRASAQAVDDTALFSSSTPPNVMLMVDNSGSMKNAVWHPDYDSTATYQCDPVGGCSCAGNVFVSSGTTNVTRCGITRTFTDDPRLTSGSTRYASSYANWIFSLPNGDPRLAEINDLSNGTYSPCLQALGFSTFSKYSRTRTVAAKDVLREVICNVNATGDIRFGIAQFRRQHDSEYHGGFVRVPIEDMDAADYVLNGSAAQSHLEHLDDAVEGLTADTWTPLGETLFQIYTYFMSRDSDDLPEGKVAGKDFPEYEYATNRGPLPDGDGDGPAPPDPVDNECQKHFVIVITDGEPTRDNFTDNGSGNQAEGFDDFVADLIGDYATDYPGENENGHRYLDDIALFMATKDFRPDIPGDQFIDTYTVGFSTNPAANDLLQATATNGNGLFKTSDNAEELATAITDAITDILLKSQAFSSATVPATRTASGGNLYTSLFIPSQDSPYWEGHLQLWQITGAGEILDENDACVFEGNPVPCEGGTFAATADPFWDAGEEVPSPNARRLFTSLPTTSARVPFVHVNDGGSLSELTLTDQFDATDDLALADIATYGGTLATNLNELSEEIVESIRGCNYATGTAANPCVERPWMLGDIFHSNPVVAGPPKAFINDPSFKAYKALPQNKFRDKVVFAGTNDGWIHGFNAGVYDPSPPLPALPGYDRGTGQELFGFMPWPVRERIHEIPRDVGLRDYYGVDGSPTVAEVWNYTSDTQLPFAKLLDGSEWMTVLMGGLRQGGNGYYALDVTDPSSAQYPGYLWEVPREDPALDPHGLRNVIAQTWGRPVITRIKVERSPGVVVERWVAVVTGGYDPTGDPNDPLNYDPNGFAGRGIFLIDIKTGELLGQKRLHAVAQGDATDGMNYAIASTPAVLDLDFDSYADVIYVGDLGGNMWRWVVKYDPNSGNVLYDAVNSAADVNQTSSKFSKFFSTPVVTVSAVDYHKSFFFPPTAALKSGKLWLAFGSGERANLKRPGDSGSANENNTFYSMTDLDPLEKLGAPSPLGEFDLYNTTTDGYCTPLGPTQRGFFFRGEDGEKFITESAIFNYWVIAGSFTPDTVSIDPCKGSGTAALYIFRIYCGDGFFAETGAGGDRKLDLGVGVPTDPKVSVGPGGTRVITQVGDGIPGVSGPGLPAQPVSQPFFKQEND